MPPTRDYYEVLEVAEDASQEEIKKNYRRLVRKYHPDVHHDKKLAERAFVQINEAYRTLSDPDKRSLYDAERRTRRRQQKQGTSRPTAQPRTASATGTPPPRSSQFRPKPTPPALDRLIRDAEFAFIRGRLFDAERLAKNVIQQDRECARAYTILGDVYNARNRHEDALQQYSYAVQFDPQNTEVQAKLNRLIGMDRWGPGKVRGGKSIRMSPSTASRIGHLAGWASFFMVFFWLPDIHPDPFGLSPASPKSLIGHWDWIISLALIVEGFLLGMLLRSGNFFGHFNDELIFQTIRRGISRPQSGPVGLLFIGLAMVFFWLALAVYVVMASLQENMSKSLMRAFSVTLIFILVAALFSEYQRGVFIIGGNFVFTSMLLGWWLVDSVRDSWVRSVDVR